MIDDPQFPDHGEDIGPCIICGSRALPKFGHFLCPQHATAYHAGVADGALGADAQENPDEKATPQMAFLHGWAAARYRGDVAQDYIKLSEHSKRTAANLFEQWQGTEETYDTS
jgi:hypothetical protein